ncbi:hypothetical protein D3C77_382620 [compost metagenome]
MKMSEYAEWEQAVTQQIADTIEVSYSDAAGVVEGQPFYMQQSWGKGMDASQTAEKILAETSAD